MWKTVLLTVWWYSGLLGICMCTLFVIRHKSSQHLPACHMHHPPNTNPHSPTQTHVQLGSISVFGAGLPCGAASIKPNRTSITQVYTQFLLFFLIMKWIHSVYSKEALMHKLVMLLWSNWCKVNLISESFAWTYEIAHLTHAICWYLLNHKVK